MASLKKLKGGLPVNPFEVLKQGKYFKEQQERAIGISLYVDPLASDALIGDTRLLLVPETSNCNVKTTVFTETSVAQVHKKSTFNIVVLGEEVLAQSKTEHVNMIRQCIVALIKSEQPFVVVTQSEAIVSLAASFGLDLTQCIVANSFEELAAKLALWCAQNLADARLALAANFEFMRHAIASEFVKATSLQNGVVGGVVFIPGADMPIMTLNQIKMVLQIAAAYGQQLDTARVKEIAAVIAGAFISRTVARELVAFVPGIGWAIKAGIGYGATYAMGVSVIEYFSLGGSEVALGTFLKSAKDDIVERACVLAEKRAEGQLPGAHDVASFARNAAQETKRLYVESKGTRV